jgi:hypothetical protein
MWGTTERMMSSLAQVPIERRYSIAETAHGRREFSAGSFGDASGTCARGQCQPGFRLAGRSYQRGRLGGNTRAARAVELLPVTVSDTPAAPVQPPAPTSSSVSPGTIQLQLPRGRLRIEGVVDTDCLRVVLNCLLA